MTAIAPFEGTGPILTPATASRARSETRRYLAELGQWAVDVAQWAHEIVHASTVELPIVTLAAGAAGLVVFTLAAVGVFELLASAVLS